MYYFGDHLIWTLVQVNVTGPRQPVWSFKMIYILWLPLLGIGVCGKEQAVH